MPRYHEVKITVSTEENVKLIKELIHFYACGCFVEDVGEALDIETPAEYRDAILKYVDGILPADKKKKLDKVRAYSARCVEKISVDGLTVTAYLTPYEAIGEDYELWNLTNYVFCEDLVWVFPNLEFNFDSAFNDNWADQSSHSSCRVKKGNFIFSTTTFVQGRPIEYDASGKLVNGEYEIETHFDNESYDDDDDF